MKESRKWRRWTFGLVLVLSLCGSITILHSDFVGSDAPAGFGVCEEVEEPDGTPRPECEASDIRFQADQGQANDFGFSLVAGHLNGDDLVDLAVGDPARNRVYIFFGRPSTTTTYGLMSDVLDRGVVAESHADVILFRDPAVPNQVGSFGFSLAVARERTAGTCPPNDTAAALLVGAPGHPGTSPNAPGRVFYIPGGGLCMTPTDPPSPQTIDPASVGQSFNAPDPEQNDEFGYSVAFGRTSGATGTEEDAIVGARGALSGAGRVTILPVSGGVVDLTEANLVKIQGAAGDGLGEALATGDLDQDFDPTTQPLGETDDLAIGAVGHDAGKVVWTRGPLSPSGGTGANGVYRAGVDPELRTILGEVSGDFFGFSVSISAEGVLAAGAIFADNDPPDPDNNTGGDERTNVETGARLNAGKAYMWLPGLADTLQGEDVAATADLVMVARRSGDQLGFGIGFGDLDASGVDEMIVTARREDGSGLKVNEIDQGTAYVVTDALTTMLISPVDLNLCAVNFNCAGVSDVNVMIFGGDRSGNQGDEMGFALATGNFNGDLSEDLFISSMTHKRVYLVTLEDSDNDMAIEGRNIRDDDDDNDGDSDADDCEPLDPAFNSGGTEIPCNGIDENCNGMADDAPDLDGDGFDACGDAQTAADCDDDDPNSYPGAPELCDGNDNPCDGSTPGGELDLDNDGYVECSGWDDTQGDDTDVLAGDDCDGSSGSTFPGAAPNEIAAAACMKDSDDDDFGDDSPPGGVTAGTDCDDSSATADTTFPGAAPSDSAQGCLKDSDGDDFGDRVVLSGVTAGNDCDDGDPASYPGAPEVCDGNDNACAGVLPADEVDGDGDDFVACSGWDDTQSDNPGIGGGDDCDDTSPFVFPGAAANEVVSGACMKDRDADGYGDITPPSGVTAGTDCDDDSTAAASTFPGAAPNDSPLNCMKDVDDDDYGDDSVSLPVVAGSDCDDADHRRFLGATETPDDGIDQDCNGADTVTCFVDDDSDGFGSTDTVLADDGECTDSGESTLDTDCDDGDADIFPGKAEILDDGIDQDCNGSDSITCVVDADEDGFGTLAGTPVVAADGSCDTADQESASADDCDDSDVYSFPGAPERCDGNDNACVGSVALDELDGDGDGYVECAGWTDTQGDNPLISGGDDCNDASAVSFPGAAHNESTPSACRKDFDGDGFGDLSPPAGVAPGTDCDDDSPTGASTFPGAAAIDGPLNCMKDLDGDDYGDASVSLPVVAGTDCDDGDALTFLGAPESCDGNDNSCAGTVGVEETDVDGDAHVACTGWNDTQGDDPAVVGGGDCDETDPATFAGAAPNEAFGAACMRDADGDDFGDIAPPAGVTPGTDCDDNSPTGASTFPGAAAIDGPLNCMRDVDDDDYGDIAATLPVVGGTDCNDLHAGVNPGTLEGPTGDPTCSDSLDNDCDGTVDNLDPVCKGTSVPCPDADNDSFADCTTDPNCDATGLICGDCDDADAMLNPGVTETCNNVDDNCDGAVDEPFDADSDGFTTCQLPEPDCNDGNPNVNPAIAEICADGVDNDCDPATTDIFDSDSDGAACDVDCNDADSALNLADADVDAFTTCAGDCDDGNPNVNPAATEVCGDGIDNDCDGGTPDVVDADGDLATCDVDCDDTDPGLNLMDADSDGFTSCAGDCNDLDSSVNPAAAEICDGQDNNCDGTVDETFDLDSDGFTTCQTPVPDCDDADATVNPGAMEVCADTIDNDCNPATPDIVDADSDGATCVLDCDDGDASSFPSAPELCDGNDNACGGLVPGDEMDVDGDGYVACSGWNDVQGDDPTVLGGDDCDETSTVTFPGSSPNEVFATACMKDADGDDFGDLSPPAGVIPGTDCDDDSLEAVNTFPGAAEIEGPLNCMKDSDDDGYGDDSTVLPVVSGTDCNDNATGISPGEFEGPSGAAVCSDTLDNDCDTLIDGADPGCSSSSTRGGSGTPGTRIIPRMVRPRDPE